jgi:hypothetical protein
MVWILGDDDVGLMDVLFAGAVGHLERGPDPFDEALDLEGGLADPTEVPRHQDRHQQEHAEDDPESQQEPMTDREASENHDPTSHRSTQATAVPPALEC